MRIVDRVSELIHNATEKFLDKRYLKQYALRFSRGESINGYYKIDGICKLVATTENAVWNEIFIKNAIYNLTLLLNRCDPNPFEKLSLLH